MNKYLITATLADKLGFPEESDLFFNLLKIKIAQEDNSEEITLDNSFGCYEFSTNSLTIPYGKFSYTKETITNNIEKIINKYINSQVNNDEKYNNNVKNHALSYKYATLICSQLPLPNSVKVNNTKYKNNLYSELNIFFKTDDLKKYWIEATNIVWKGLVKINEFQDEFITPKSMLIDRIYQKQMEQSKIQLSDNDYNSIKKLMINDQSIIGIPIQSLIIIQSTKNEVKTELIKITKVFGNKSLDWIMSQMTEKNKEPFRKFLDALKESLIVGSPEQEVPKKILESIGTAIQIEGFATLHDIAHVLPDNTGTVRGLDKLSTFLFQNSNKDKIQLKEITNAWEKLPLEIRKEAFSKGFDYVLNYVRNNIAIHENATDIEFSRESGKWGIKDENKYKNLEDYYKSSQNTPLPEWAKYSAKSGNYIGSFLPRNDPRGMYLGHHTNCCQHPEGAGSYCAFHGQGSPTGAFFVIEDSKGTILCESWVWEDNKGDVVFDNAESVLQKDDPRRNTFAEIYKLISGKLPARNVYLGSSMNDIATEGIDKIKFKPQSWDKHEYTDAKKENYLLSHKPYINTEVQGNYTIPGGELGTFKTLQFDENKKFMSQPHYKDFSNWEDTQNDTIDENDFGTDYE